MISLDKVNICFSIPASPTDEFFAQIAMFRMALDQLGGHYQTADIAVFLGHELDEQPPLPEYWRPHLSENVEFHWTTAREFKKKSYLAQGDARWNHDYSDYDLVVFTDADVLVMQAFDDLILQNQAAPAVNGVIAHYSPAIGFKKDPLVLWNDLSNMINGKPVQFQYRHTLEFERPPEFTYCPFYINFGFIAVSPEELSQFAASFLDIRARIAEKISMPYFSAQLALPLALEKETIKRRALGMRFNYPNDVVADTFQINELYDIRVMHYLREDHFLRSQIFNTKENFEAFLRLELAGSNLLFQTFVAELTGGEFPF